MTKLRSLALASLAFSAALSAFVIACGDDTGLAGPDLDGGTDATTTVDTGPGPGDGGGTDAKPDVAPPKDVNEFKLQVAAALCSSLARCCFGNANVPDGGAVDGGTYNGSKCEDLYRDIGFEFSSTGASFVDGGEAVVDDAKSVACLTTVANLSCSLTGAEMSAARKTCFEALVGKGATGTKCEAAIECAAGNFCDPDGGTCAPLRGDGGACAIFNTGNDEVDSVRSEEACSWRGSGDTQLRCDSYDWTNFVYRPRGEWRCQPQVQQDAGCNSTVWCKDAICDPFDGYYCKSPVEIFTNYCGRVLN